MTDVFLQVLNGSFAASWLVLAVIAARLLLKKAPRWMVCALWALVAVRLIFGGIEAPFSLVPSGQIIPPESLFAAAPTIQSGISSIDNAINPVYTEALRPATGASVNPLQVWLAVFANIWVLGAAAMALWALISWLRVRRQVRESIPAQEGVYLCDRICSPFLFGLLRPKIYLPSELDGGARRYVIAHERAHLRRRDHWWKPLGFVLLAVNWFNPLLWLAYLLLCRDIELACDEKVVRNYTVEEKKAYSAALLGCSVNSRRITACPLAFGEVGVKQRVKSVLHYKKPALWIILAAAVLTGVIAVSLLTDPVDRVSEVRYNGNLYVLFNEDYSFLPVEDPVGELRSILHRTGDHPSENFQGTNLDESLAGCPLYLENDLLFLQKFDGTCLAFRLADAEIRTFTWGNISLEVTLPAGWEAEPLSETSSGNRFGLRCRPAGRNAWMTVTFYDTEETAYESPLLYHTIELANGATGREYQSHDPTRWELIILDTASGQLHITPPEFLSTANDWTAEDYQTARSIPETLSVTRDGFSLLTALPTANTLPGITLTAENVTSRSLQLVYTHLDPDAQWARIVSTPAWDLEAWTEEGWVSILPPGTAWNDVAYELPINGTVTFSVEFGRVCGTLEPGRYRIGKEFTAHPEPEDIKSTTEAFREIFWAEFDTNS